VVSTYTLCTIPDPESALAEMRRVLRPDGVLLFCEHGRAPDEAVRKWQDRVDPLWTRVTGGCHINRDIKSLIEGAGFEIAALDTMYIPGWKPASFNFRGSAG
jgi:ubiquinone/menaquinone biosynthesis C-methylase UbiE